MKIVATHSTLVGPFHIARSADGRFHLVFDGEDLGSYSEAWQAVDDLTSNATFSACHPTTGELLDTSALGIPEDIRDWKLA